jgi:hypothetical protein
MSRDASASSGSRASTTATISSDTKLDRCGMSPNAVANTPATDPTVLTKNTFPAPPSPPAVRRRSSSTAMRNGFMADVATSGTNSIRKQPANAPSTRWPAASVGNRTGYATQVLTIASDAMAGISRNRVRSRSDAARVAARAATAPPSRYPTASAIRVIERMPAQM